MVNFSFNLCASRKGRTYGHFTINGAPLPVTIFSIKGGLRVIKTLFEMGLIKNLDMKPTEKALLKAELPHNVIPGEIEVNHKQIEALCIRAKIARDIVEISQAISMSNCRIMTPEEAVLN